MVQIPFRVEHALASWTGTCDDGKADGRGSLEISLYGQLIWSVNYNNDSGAVLQQGVDKAVLDPVLLGVAITKSEQRHFFKPAAVAVTAEVPAFVDLRLDVVVEAALAASKEFASTYHTLKKRSRTQPIQLVVKMVQDGATAVTAVISDMDSSRTTKLADWRDCRNFVQERAFASVSAAVSQALQAKRARDAEADREKFYNVMILCVPLVLLLLIAYKVHQLRVAEDLHEADRRRLEAERREQLLREEERRLCGVREAAETRRRRLEQLARECAEEIRSLPRLLVSADEGVTEATQYLGERAFSPFWDAVESVAATLVEFEGAVSRINARQREFVQVARQGDVTRTVPIRSELVEGLQVSQRIAGDLREIAGKAQRDFEFSSIFEQRRTSKALVSGFRTVSEAMSTIGDRITNSISDLAVEVNSMSASVNEFGCEVSQMSYGVQAKLGDISFESKKMGAGVAAELQRLGESQEQAVDILCDIRRGRRPGLLG